MSPNAAAASFDAILGPQSEADVEVGLEAAEAWLLASTAVVATA